MRITILGAGEVGLHLARQLDSDHHEVTLIDSDSEAVRRARDELEIAVIRGHGGNVDVLESASVGTSDLFCAVTPQDELNMLSSLLAKKLGCRQTAVRISGLSHVAQRRFFYRKTLDFDLTISPEEMTAAAISRIVRGQDSHPIESVAEGKIELHRYELLGRFDAVGKKIKDIKLPKQCLVVALFRGTQIMVPTGEDEVREGDEVMLIGASETMERVDKILGGRRRLPRRVMIVGGGPVGQAAAETFARLKIKVKLLERNRARAEELAEKLPHALIEHADGTRLQDLLEENADRMDLFLALTGLDEANLLSCQLAREVGAKETIALVSRSDYNDLYKRLQVNAIISPRRLIADRIARFVESGCRSGVTPIEHGRAEILELEVGGNPALIGKPLRDIEFPRGALVGAVIRAEDVFVPSGDDALEVGDTVVVFALTQAHREIEALFE